MKAIVDQDTCISCGACIATCPEVFQFNNDSKSHAVVDTIPSELEESADAARDACPVAAIDLKE